MEAVHALATPRNTSLAALSVYLSVLGITIHLSREATGVQYRATALVVLTELGKLIVAGALAFNEARRADSDAAYAALPSDADTSDASSFGGEGRSAVGSVAAEVFAPGWLGLSLPALLFVVQNNLNYLGLSNLSLPAFQVLSQLKVRPPLTSRRLIA